MSSLDDVARAGDRLAELHAAQRAPTESTLATPPASPMDLDLTAFLNLHLNGGRNPSAERRVALQTALEQGDL